MRVVAPAKDVVQIDGVLGQRYSAKDGIYDMPLYDAQAAVKIGASIASLAGTTRAHYGFPCRTCGFGSYFRRCSRCGAEN